MIDYEIERYIVQKEQTLLEAMQIITRNRQGVGFVCEKYKLMGALSDGDIRRELIKSNNLSNKVDSAVNYNPCYVNCGEKEVAEKLLYESDLSAIPLVDSQGILVGVAVKEILFPINKKVIDLPVIIMAGGEGNRLKPYTDVLPKPLIPIGNRTIIERVIDQFKDVGCLKFGLIVNYKKDLLKAYFNEIRREYIVNFYEEEQFLGTAGGLRLVESEMKETFLVSNCDILVNCDYYKLIEKHKREKNIITVVGVKKKITIPYGVLEVDPLKKEIKEIDEKPSYEVVINTGLYVVEPEFIQLIPMNTFIHITDVIEKVIIQHKKAGVYMVEEDEWFDMGQFSEMEKMKRKILF